jgi:hypothetical protein
MSKTLLHKVAFYINDEEMERFDQIRGKYIPRSRLGALAARRLIADAEDGKVELLPLATSRRGKEVEK